MFFFFSQHTKYSRYSLISKGKMGHVTHFLPIKFIQSNSFDLWEFLNLLFFTVTCDFIYFFVSGNRKLNRWVLLVIFVQ